MQKQILAIAMFTIVTSLGFTALSNNAAFGQGVPQQGVPSHANPNAAFGQGASSFPPGSMGQHSSNPIPDPSGTPPQDIDRDVPRLGLGNVQQGLAGEPIGQPVPGISKHPADLACALDPTLSLC